MKITYSYAILFWFCYIFINSLRDVDNKVEFDASKIYQLCGNFIRKCELYILYLFYIIDILYALSRVNFQKNSLFSCFELLILLHMYLLFTSKFCSQYCFFSNKKLCFYTVHYSKKVECRYLAVVKIFLSQRGFQNIFYCCKGIIYSFTP